MQASASTAGNILARLRPAHGHRWAVILLLCLGIALRCAAFGAIPAGLNQDEASMAYDAYADMTYGTDRNGDHNPIYAVSWGSGQNMLYNYMVRPWIALLGLTATAIRLPMLLMNILSLLAFYGLARECLDAKTALWALFLLAICPWHVMLSRWALESNLAVPLVIFAGYAFARSRKNPVWFAAGMAFGALCMYAYAATLLFLALWIPAIVIGSWVQHTVPKRWLAAGTAVFLLLALPMAVFVAANLFDLPVVQFAGFAIPRLSEMRSADTTVLLGNQPRLNALLQNLWKLGKLFLTMDDGSVSNTIAQIGAIYRPLIPLILLGAAAMLRRLRGQSRAMLLPVAWLLAAVVHSAMVVVNINRINILFPVLILCAAVGARVMARRLRYSGMVIAIVCLVCAVVFGVTYFRDYPAMSEKVFHAGLDDAIAYATEHTDGTVYCTDSVNAPYIFALYANQTDPAVFMATVAYDDLRAPFRYVYGFDRFVTGIPDVVPVGESCALVVQADDPLPDTLATQQAEKQSFGNYQVIVLP